METGKKNITFLERENERLKQELVETKKRMGGSSDNYYKLFDRSIAGLFRANYDGTIREANPAFATLLGYESTSDLINDHKHQPHINYILDANKDFLNLPEAGNPVTNKEIVVFDKDGKSRFCLLTWYLVMEGGEKTIEGHLIDISKQKTEEAKATHYIAQLHKTQSMAKIAFFDYCLDSDETRFSDNMHELLGTELKNPLDFNALARLIHPDDKGFVTSSVESSIRQKKAETEIQFRIVTSTEKSKHLTCSFHHYYTFGKYSATSGWLQDITELKKSQLLLKENLNMLETVLNTIPVSVFWKDDELRFAGSNRKFLDDAGIKYPKDLVGKKEMDMPWSKDVQEIFEQDDAYILQTGEPQLGFEEVIKTDDDKEHWIRGSKVPLHTANGEVIGVLGVFMDITDSKKNENELFNANLKLAENDMLKTSFLANISHEVRTPLSAIVGFADMLTKDHIPASEISHFTRLIQNQADHLLKVVSDILDISLIESNQIKLEQQTIDVVELLNDQYLILGHQLKNLNNDHIRAKLSIPKSIKHFYIKGDKVRIRQVLNNLIDNAIKFTQFGFIELGFQTDGDNKAQIFVKDSGIGIDEKNKSLIFERFRKGDHTFKKQFSGLGLGLAIAKELTQRMEGDLWFESELEMGSSFYFSIPVAEDAPEQIQHDTANNDVLLDEVTWDNKTILVADDVKHMHQLMNLFLRDKGVTIINVMSGEEAVEKVKQFQNIDMIFMDVQMPGMGGIAAMKKISRLVPEIPLVAFTAYAMEGDKEKYLEQGFWDYISKPINQNDLLQLMHKYWEIIPSQNRN